MALWGSLYPCIKIGYRELHINTSSIPDILAFAAIRFTVCGALVTLYSFFVRKKAPPLNVRSVFVIAAVGLFSVVLHYSFHYVGLTLTDSSKTAIIKQTASLIYVCFAFLFFKDEKFSVFRILGALIGFTGIVAINWSAKSISFSSGDLLILGASCFTVVANVLTRTFLKSTSPFYITGISQLSGGVILLIAALALGASFPVWSLKGALIFVYICAASIASYTLWYTVLSKNELSNLFIIKFAEPLFACAFSALFLGENIFRWQYAAAFLLISVGIVIAEKSNRKDKKQS